MSNKNIESQDKTLENIESTLSKTEQFIEKNQNKILYILGGIILVVALYWAFVRFYQTPRNVEADTQIFVAQQHFAADSFALALNGNVSTLGFLGIIDDYSGTKAANLAHFYAGICYLNLKDYDNAFNQIKKFRTTDILLASEKYGILGDICVEQDKLDEAIKWYNKATKENYSNNFSTPIYLKKLGLVYEKLNKFAEAQKVYETIFYKYPQSNEARTIEKYIERAKLGVK